MARWLAALVALMVLVAPGIARADKPLAETLFMEGKELMKQGKLEEACKRFKASHQAEESVGALLNLARCHQELGKLASAWSEFKEAAALAERVKQPERKQGALDYAAEIEPQLSRLTIAVESPVAGQLVRYGDSTLPELSYGVAVPVDPGTYLVEATAAGHETWSKEVTVGPNADAQELTIPPLVARVAPAPRKGIHPRVIAGFVVGAVGVVSLAVGIAFGAVAIGDKDDLDAACKNKRCAPGDGQDQLDSITLKANVSTATIAIGAAAIIGGGVLVLTAPNVFTSEGGLSFTPLIGPETAGLDVSGWF